MISEYLTALKAGRLTPDMLIEGMMTEVGGGVYSYMVMLQIAGRQNEANFFEDIRKIVFDIRSRVKDTSDADLLALSNEWRAVSERLLTAEIYLRAHKPEEAGLLQSVNNTACGLIHTIKHYRDPVKVL